MSEASKKTQFKKGQSGNPNGAPEKYNEKYIKKLTKLLKEYTDKTQVPIIKEFLLEYEKELNYIDYDTFYFLYNKHPLLLSAKKRCLAKKEVTLERALMGGANNTGIIFILKQMGWKDNPEANINVTNIVQQEEKKEKFKRFTTEDLEKLNDIFNSVENKEE